MRTRPILIIDDDSELCDLVDSALSGIGFKVLAAFDGPTGIETAREAHPAVILLDMMMPGLDGIATCQRLKQDPVLGDIPVVGMTASADLKYAEKVFRAGGEFFLPKPFRAENLLRVVRLAADTAERQARTPRQQRRLRLTVEVPVRCLIHEGSHPTREIVGRTGNVSLSGLLLLLPEIVARGIAVRLLLELPEGSLAATDSAMVSISRALPTISISCSIDASSTRSLRAILRRRNHEGDRRDPGITLTNN